MSATIPITRSWRVSGLRLLLVTLTLVAHSAILSAEEAPRASRLSELPPDTASVVERVAFYMDRLGDSTYVSTYGCTDVQGTWYIAAEELGQIGAPALSQLIQRVVLTRSEYERRVGLYALRLASQDTLIRNGLRIPWPEYPDAFPEPARQPEIVGRWVTWWLANRNAIEGVVNEGSAHRSEHR